MRYETILYRLKLKGYTMSKIAKEMGTTRQNVRAALLYGKGKWGKTKHVREKILGLIDSVK